MSGNGQVKHDDFVEGATGVLDADFSMGLLRPALKCMAAHCLPGAIAFVCVDWRGAPFLLDAAQGVFHELKNLIVWVKSNAGQGAFYRSQHELTGCPNARHDDQADALAQLLANAPREFLCDDVPVGPIIPEARNYGWQD